MTFIEQGDVQEIYQAMNSGCKSTGESGWEITGQWQLLRSIKGCCWQQETQENNGSCDCSSDFLRLSIFVGPDSQTAVLATASSCGIHLH